VKDVSDILRRKISELSQSAMAVGCSGATWRPCDESTSRETDRRTY